ncbi:MAG: extracellular solute-binding protein [Firmicutes bacterium]|nr:extracellular solute-binding protein [Bacillota bacterium]
MQKRSKVFLTITAGLLLLALVACAVTVGGKEKYDFGGRTITYSAWWELRPDPGASVEMERQARRVAEVEKKYNVKVNYVNIPWGEYLARYIATVMAGDSMGDIVTVEANWFYPTLLLNNFCTNLSELGVFDFTAEKFQRETVEFGTYRGSVYAYDVGRLYPRGVLYWNKSMFAREGLPDLYEIFFNYEWTWEKMLEFAKALTKDIDGDGIIDQWGIGGAAQRLERGFVISNNAHYIDISDKDNPKFALTHPNAIEALQAHQDFILKHQVVSMTPEGAPWDYNVQSFIEGKIGMLVGQFWKINDYMKGKMQDEYGVVLFPMGPKAKEYTSELTGHNFKTVPITVKNPKEVAIVENAMTEPFPDEAPDEWREYYELMVNDEESIKTVEMIWEKQLGVVNLQWAFGINDIFYTIEWEVMTGNKTPTAAVEAFAQEAQARINDSLEF